MRALEETINNNPSSLPLQVIIKNSKFKIPFEICVTRLHLEKSKLDLKGLGRGAIEEAMDDPIRSDRPCAKSVPARGPMARTRHFSQRKGKPSGQNLADLRRLRPVHRAVTVLRPTSGPHYNASAV